MRQIFKRQMIEAALCTKQATSHWKWPVFYSLTTAAICFLPVEREANGS